MPTCVSVHADAEAPCACCRRNAPSCHSQLHQCLEVGPPVQPCIKISTQEMLLATGRPRLAPQMPVMVLIGSRTNAGKHRTGLMIRKGREKVMKSLVFSPMGEKSSKSLQIWSSCQKETRSMGHLGKPPWNKLNVLHLILSKEEIRVLQPAVKCSAAKISTKYDRCKAEKASEVSFH